MAKTDIYSKLRRIVQFVQNSPGLSEQDLVDALHDEAKRGGNGFIYYRKDGGNTEELACDPERIRTHVSFAQTLGLVSGGEVTAINGLDQATTNQEFSDKLETQVIEFLEGAQITIEQIQDAIEDVATSDVDSIHGKLGSSSLSRTRFKICLNLLGETGTHFQIFRGKQFLPN